MRLDECKSVVKSFFMAEMNLLTYHNADESTSEKSKDRIINSVANMTLSVIAEDSGINTISLLTLQGICSKAIALIHDSNSITLVPGTDKQARAVKSYHSSTPPYCSLKTKWPVCL